MTQEIKGFLIQLFTGKDKLLSKRGEAAIAHFEAKEKFRDIFIEQIEIKKEQLEYQIKSKKNYLDDHYFSLELKLHFLEPQLIEAQYQADKALNVFNSLTSLMPDDKK